MDRVVILVPRRADHGRRDQLWAWCRRRWEDAFPEWPIYEGHHLRGPFNRSWAINEAADRAGDWDVAVVIDSDIIEEPAAVQEAVGRARATDRVVWPHTGWRGLTDSGTDALMAGRAGDLGRLTWKSYGMSWSCCFAITRPTWDVLGGLDERFEGWGFEDMAFAAAVRTGPGAEHLPGEVVHLWHPRSEERIEIRKADRQNLIHMTPEYLANLLLAQRYRDSEGIPQIMDSLLAEAQRKRHRAPERGIVIAAVTNGRRAYLEHTIPAAEARLHAEHVVRRVIYDDSGDPDFRAWLATAFPQWYPIGHPEHRGYTPTMAALWRYMARKPGDYVFLLEEDFVIDRDVDLDAMAAVLEANPHLAQLVLLRGAFYPREVAAGGIIEEFPDEFTRASDGNGGAWIEHRRFWSNNPMLMRKATCSRPWPQGKWSEALFGQILNRDPANRFAFWGSGETWCTHIGAERTGDGY